MTDITKKCYDTVARIALDNDMPRTSGDLLRLLTLAYLSGERHAMSRIYGNVIPLRPLHLQAAK